MHFILTVIHERSDFRILLSQLVSHQPPLLMTFCAVVLGEDRAQQCRHHRSLAFTDMSHGIAYEVDSAALPRRMEDLGYGGLKPFMGIGDHQLYTAQAASHEASQEVRPEWLGFRRADAHAQDFPATMGVHRHGDYDGARHNTAGLPYFDVGGINPEIGSGEINARLLAGLHNSGCIARCACMW
ncbi:hypothetical protein SAMN05216598_3756 [Pseudomonas asplenii]|uniref:Uncharacterized protein n=1 Tax=Pseudomonas asplenii TaxID=53407 RepID=A0A1H1X819_9PSED|nr:hypothetical protein SAMN05216598_3756 [Pseudomonas asplenii]